MGFACNFVPHNVESIIEATEAYIRNSFIDGDKLFEIVQGPDFPTGGMVVNKDDLPAIYREGRGKIKLRGRFKVEGEGRKKTLVFYEIPYGIKKLSIIEGLVKRVEEGEIPGVVDVRDESSDEVRIAVELDFDVDPIAVSELIYSKTYLETTISFNQTCLVNGTPRTLTLKQVIKHYVEFQQDIIRRRTQYDLNKVTDRIEIIEGLILALNNIAKVIQVVKSSGSNAEAQAQLQEGYSLTELQARAILGMRLSTLTKLETNSLEKELAELGVLQKQYERILTMRKVLNETLIEEMKSYAKEFYSPRKTVIEQVNIEKAKTAIAVVEKEAVPLNIFIDINHYIYLGTDKEARSKKFYGRYIYRFTTYSDKQLVVFSSDGRAHRIPADKFETGKNLKVMLNLPKDVSIVGMEIIRPGGEFMGGSKFGYVIRLRSEEFMSKNNRLMNSFSFMRLREGDELVGGAFVEGDMPSVFIVSKRFRVIHFDTEGVSVMKKNAMGVKGINLEEGDEVASFALTSEGKDSLFITTATGRVKRTPIHEYQKQGRGGKGKLVARTIAAENDEAVAANPCKEDSELVIFTETEIVRVEADKFRESYIRSHGNRYIKSGRVLQTVALWEDE